jgi:hypothetical protein
VSCADTRIPGTPTARKALHELKHGAADDAKRNAGPAASLCKTPGPLVQQMARDMQLKSNVTPRVKQAAAAGLAGALTPQMRLKLPTPGGQQYPITPEECVSSPCTISCYPPVSDGRRCALHRTCSLTRALLYTLASAASALVYAVPAVISS